LKTPYQALSFTSSDNNNANIKHIYFTYFS
jgi:hypothetical protein